jgi:hypothetical protein
MFLSYSFKKLKEPVVIDHVQCISAQTQERATVCWENSRTGHVLFIQLGIRTIHFPARIKLSGNFGTSPSKQRARIAPKTLLRNKKRLITKNHLCQGKKET